MVTITSTCQGLGSVTSTPALTTTFTAPAWCSTRFFAKDLPPPYDYGWHDFQDPRWYSCVPPEWNATACQSLVFSPGICPDGWYAQANDGQGATTCCMSGFTYGSFDGKCMKADVTNYELAVLATASDGRYQSPTASDNGTAIMTSGTLDHVFIVVHTATALPTSSAVPTATTLPTSSGAPAPTTLPTSSGLGGGAIAGIVVGIVAFIVLAASLAYWTWMRSHRRDDSNETYMTLDHVRSENHGRSELHADDLPPTAGKAELSGEGISELGSAEPRSDHSTGHQPPAELAA
ncbi:uncharacterized protein CDV56_104618 [Aspergillus thermomutatus]|uniref:Mid2 domain-containing protein n=1 Tax=Aspergillus thermomutatus TaxID=41047 RepID=A0A397G503_ASPTH|nr:uncharacterized protein CDV56_104618 [Aspergillus thermomutatus]RHZ46121.1 hypothetical protein CDV56_104618 [Aspergillus thermomutatus]